jgi:hypothetical protein
MEKQHSFSSVSRVLGVGAVIGAAALAGAMRAPVAHACGGFFCSQANPVDQSAEEIIFIDNPDDTVTAVIRINYQGPSQKFAWVLPIDGVPAKVDVSSNVAFDNLRNATDPQYTLTTTVEGTCKQQQFANGVGFSGATTAPTAGGAAADSGVTVLDQGSVGPYDWEVIKVDPQLTDAADAAVTWLTGHGYDVTALGPDVLRPYLKDGLNLMAFKLTKAADATTGSIRPVMLTYNSKLPMIPIRPTAVAAQPDMGILVWLLSDKQAVPQNYKSLVLNEALINWFPNYYFGGGAPIGGFGISSSQSSSPSNYRQVVTAAADEAGGQGFVTEMAGDSKKLDQLVFPNYQQQQWMQFSLQTFADGYDMMQQASSQYRGWDGLKDAMCGALTLPSGLTCDTFVRNPAMYRSMVQIDSTKFLKGLYEGVVKPVITTQDLLLSRPYFTRMFTTMSPEEMTMDPLFDFNPDLADVSNLHMATQIIECSPDITQDAAPWRILLPQGGVISGKGSNGTWPIAIGGAVPANLKVVQLGTSGSGKVTEDNSSMILKALAAQSGTSGTSGQKPPDQRVPIGGSTGGTGVPIGGGNGTGGSGATGTTGAAGSGASSHSSGGCSISRPGAVAQWGWLVPVAGIIGLRLRPGRRRRGPLTSSSSCP